MTAVPDYSLKLEAALLDTAHHDRHGYVDRSRVHGRTIGRRPGAL
jgi:hypothetical protein